MNLTFKVFFSAIRTTLSTKTSREVEKGVCLFEIKKTQPCQKQRYKEQNDPSQPYYTRSWHTQGSNMNLVLYTSPRAHVDSKLSP